MKKVTASELNYILYRVSQLRKISNSLQHLAEASCNYGLTKRQETRERNLLQKGKELAQELGYEFYHQGDPRGCQVYLLDHGTPHNSYNHGVAIY